MRKLILLSLLALPGCSLFTKPAPRYVPVPEGYLVKCPLPPIPVSNAELSDAFARAYLCAKQGNEDKDKIRALNPAD